MKKDYDISHPRSIKAKRNQKVTVEDVLRAAHVDISDPELLKVYNKAFKVENHISSF